VSLVYPFCTLSHRVIGAFIDGWFSALRMSKEAGSFLLQTFWQDQPSLCFGLLFFRVCSKKRRDTGDQPTFL